MLNGHIKRMQPTYRDIIKVLTFLIIDSQTCDQMHLEKNYEKRGQEVFLCYNCRNKER